MRNIGDEVKIRAQRGEKPAVVSLPEGISEEDDSEDFVLGLPEQTAEEPADVPSEDNPAEAEAGTENASSDGDGIPDLDSLLNLQSENSDDEPDLSEFLEEPEEQEPEEIPLEDLDFESLLKSTPDGTADPEENAAVADGGGGSFALDDFPLTEPLASEEGFESPLAGEDVLSGGNPLSEGGGLSGGNELSELDALFKDNALSMEDSLSEGGGLSEDNPLSEGGGLSDDEDDFAFSGDAIDLNADVPDEIAEMDGVPVEDVLPETAEGAESGEGENAEAGQNGVNAAETPVFGENAEGLSEFSETDNNAFSMPEDFPSAEDFLTGGESLSEPEGLTEDALPSEGETLSEEEALSEGNPLSEGGEALSFSPEDFNLPDLESFGAESDGGLEVQNAGDALSVGDENDLAAAEILKGLSGNGGEDGLGAGSESVPVEDFSSSLAEMGSGGSIDFGNLSSIGAGEEFPVTGIGKNLPDDDFLLDDEEFRIPGFSDTTTAAFDKKGHPKVDTVDFSGANTGKPKNTLTDEEYAVFRKNLSDYPLNLRLAVEDLIVKNEFTDDAVFEIIEKILNKTPARQIASQLEKMLDITIDVPRDYERRSFEQYEAYKQSFQYQLKNRIIPGTIAGVLLAFICSLLFQAGVMFVYKPVMAKILYKQGYVLLQNNEYPQSDAKFLEAVHYKPVKKWFFKYAEGYREHKQFERAAQMYKNILGVFRHDKNAGLQWADMELYDRANYERSEEIVRREILDWHINDPDGLLLLGDVFLEWGESDYSKYEKARQTYSDLIQLYGGTDLYMSRMMRYFIRTDRLKNVLELKNHFYPREKSLEAADWTELSGYLLDKLYGELSRSEEYLRAKIEDVKAMLEIAQKKDPQNPLTHYNSARYFMHNSNFESARRELQVSLDCFENQEVRSKKSVYREIDACRLLGELYADVSQYLKAQEVYTRGITLFQSENEKNGLEGDLNTGILYADMGDLEYFISGDMDAALRNYEQAVLNKNSNPSVNYRIGAINYNKKNYEKALKFFITAAEKKDSDENLLLATGNTLALRGDIFAAQGYYSRLLEILNDEKAQRLVLFPQVREEDTLLVEMLLKANNNLGVVLNKIARQTGNSQANGKSFECFVQSIRAWDALTRDAQTMVRLGGSNLALQNSKYITASMAEFEPAIYTDIPRILVGEKILR